MAGLTVQLMTAEQKQERAKELFNSGSRNYHDENYSEAAEDLRRACELYVDLFGKESEQIGHPYLYYAKTLIALAQRGEDKLLALGVNFEGGKDDLEDENLKPTVLVDEGAKLNEAAANGDTNDKPQSVDSSNGFSLDQNATAHSRRRNFVPMEILSEGPLKKAKIHANNGRLVPHAWSQPGTPGCPWDPNAEDEEDIFLIGCCRLSSGKCIHSHISMWKSQRNDRKFKDSDENTNKGNKTLRCAFESLSWARRIFKQMGECALPDLANVYYELGELSYNNGEYSGVIDDYGK